MSFGIRSRIAPSGKRFRGWPLVMGLMVLPLESAAFQLSVPTRISSCENVRSLLQSAQQMLGRGDFATALQTLNRVVAANPNCADAYLLLGLTEFQQGKTTSSIQNYKRALKLDPRSYSTHYNLALAYLRGHRIPEARVELEQAVKLDPRQSDAAYDLGVVLLELGKPSAALLHLRRAKALNSQRPDVAFNIVRAELQAGHTPEAAAEAQSSAQRLATDFQWNAAIGQLFAKNAQFKYAAIYLGQANRIRPEDSDIRHQLAVAYLESRQPDQVLSTIPEAKTGDDFYLRASAYYISHQFPEADRESEQGLALAPENPHILVLRTRLLQRAGQQEAALAAAQKAATLAPKWDEPYYLAGVSSYFIRRYDQAAEALARAIALNPNSARAFFLQSIALANQSKVHEAEQSLRRAIELQPQNARFHCHLGILLARQNEDAKAEASLRQAIQLKPDYGLSHYELGKLLAHAQRLQPAALELTQAVTYDPTLGAAYYQLSRVYAKLGETEKSDRARAEFEKLYQREADDAQAADRVLNEDALKETEAP